MAPNKEFSNEVMNLLAPLGSLDIKPMFGGYGIFHEGAMFALISGNGLFFKVDNSNRATYEKAGSKQYKPMPYYQVPADIFKEEAKLLAWASESIKIAHSTAQKKKH